MKKIIIIGSPGAGKSTFAKKLHSKIKFPLFHLDMIWHKPDKTTVTREEFDSRLMSIMSGSEWIIDGNYSRTLKIRLDKCDTIFLFDIPAKICMEGAKARVGAVRGDMPWVEDNLDEAFGEWIEAFPKEELPKIYTLLENHREKSIYIFKSRKEADDFLASL